LGTPCPVCASTTLQPFFALDGLPALCNALWSDRTDAEAAARGDVRLAVCTDCGMITNTAFDAGVFGYSPQYENSLHFSPAFQDFASSVAERLVRQYDLHGVDIVEIGPGGGDFLAMLCQLGDNRGVGYDPSHEPHRAPGLDPRVAIVDREFPNDGSPRGRLVCARHVLEHVPDPGTLLGAMSLALDDVGVAYLEVPDGWYLIDRVALWDVIYEHCHHFTAPALQRLAGAVGMRLLDSGTAFGDQFLWADAAPGKPSSGNAPDREPVDAIVAQAMHFGERATALLAHATEMVSGLTADGPVVLWGAGSKGVTFLNMVENAGEVRGAVDINPHKRGRYVPVSGHQVVAPADLRDDPPATAIVLNPIYVDEIGRQLFELGLETRVVAIEQLVPPTPRTEPSGAGAGHSGRIT
jgi:hypothetical protein